MGRNSPGRTIPRSGSSQRNKASTPSQPAGRDVYLGLVVEQVPLILQRTAQAVLEGETGSELGAQVETVMLVLLACGLRLAQSRLRILHERLGILAAGSAAGET